MLTAIVSPVPIGNRSIEGLLLQDGTYAIAVPQICSIFSFLIKNATRDIKAILGADFQFLKARTTLNSKAVNCVTLKDFERIKDYFKNDNSLDYLIALSENPMAETYSPPGGRILPPDNHEGYSPALAFGLKSGLLIRTYNKIGGDANADMVFYWFNQNRKSRLK